MNKLLKILPLFALGAATAGASVISTNFVNFPLDGTNGNRFSENITGAETFGLADYDGLGTSTVLGNWNAITGADGGASGLIDSLGAATSVDVTNSTTDATLFQSSLNNTAYKAGLVAFKNTTRTATFTGLNSFSATYDVIVFVGKEVNATDLTVNGVLRTYTAGSVLGESWVFQGLTSDDLVVNLLNSTTNSESSNFAVLGGVQIVAVPEPSTYALLAGMATLGLVMVRRRRMR